MIEAGAGAGAGGGDGRRLCCLAGFGAKRRSRGHPATWSGGNPGGRYRELPTVGVATGDFGSGRMPPDMFLNCNEEIKRRKDRTIRSQNRCTSRVRFRDRGRGYGSSASK